MELNRIHSHLVWLGTSALDLGAISMFWYCFRERDAVLDMFEMSAGQRMHTRYFQVGGVFEDIPLGFERKLREFIAIMPSRIDQFEALLDQNEIFLQRTKNIGIVSRERLLELGVTGPLLRAAGEPWDLRKTDPFLAYDEVDFKIPVGTVGDGYDRYRCRVAEMRESVRILEQCLDGLPEGPVIADDRKIVLPPRDELGTSMEALIHHFKLVTEGFRVPPGELYHPIEGPRGELGCFIVADGSAKPARVHFRDSVLRQPPGAARDVRRRLGRRPDPEPGDARPDPRRHRPVSPLMSPLIPKPRKPWQDDPGHIHDSPGPPPTEGEPPVEQDDLGPGGVSAPAEPRGVGETLQPEVEPVFDPADERDPEPVPDINRGRRAGRAARTRSAPRWPSTREKRSASIPALWAVQRMYGWCTPEGIRAGRRGDGGDARLPAVGRDLLRPLPHSSRTGEHEVLVCTNISCWLRGADDILGEFLDGRLETTSRCAASSASAPATSRRWPRSTSATSARSSPATQRRSRASSPRARTCSRRSASRTARPRGQATVGSG